MARDRAFYENQARLYARQAGIPEDIFLRQIKQESGFNPGARSGAGAVGIAQIVPRWHPDVNPNLPGNQAAGVNPQWDLAYAARMDANNYKKYGNWNDTLSVYNSGRPWSKGQTFKETSNYVRSILSGQNPASAPASQMRAPQAAFDPGAQQGSDRRRAALLGMLSSRSDDPLLFSLLSQKLEGQSYPEMQETTMPNPGPKPGAKGSQGITGGVVLSPGADREGVSTNPAVTSFVSQIAGIYGQPLTIGTGTQHNQFVKGTQRESAHWTGFAADISAAGEALTRMGQAALIAAGMPPAEARKQKGGLFNINGKQVIFNTNEGGNHYNHLHVGLQR